MGCNDGYIAAAGLATGGQGIDRPQAGAGINMHMVRQPWAGMQGQQVGYHQTIGSSTPEGLISSITS